MSWPSTVPTVQLSLKIVPYPRSWVRRTSWPCCTPDCRRPSPPRLATSRGKHSASSPAWAAAAVKTPLRTEASQRHTVHSQIRPIYDLCQFFIQICVSRSGSRNFRESSILYFIIFNYHYLPVFDNIFFTIRCNINSADRDFCGPPFHLR
jgi:hypothetical protein